MNPEFCPNELYIKDEATGEFIPMGNITYSALEPIKLEPVVNEDTFSLEIKKLSEATFEATLNISSIGWHLRKYSINNWRKNHGLPLIRRRNKR